MSFPTLTQIGDANWDYLTANATAWTALANTWEIAFTEIRDASVSPGGTPWTGAGGLSFAGVGLDGLVTVNDILNGAPASEEVAKLGGRTTGAWLGGFAAGAAWGSWVGPEGTVIVGLLGSLAGGFGGDKLVQKMMGG